MTGMSKDTSKAPGAPILKRDPRPEEFAEALRYLEEAGFKVTVHRFGPKCRVDLGWPDDRRGVRLPEWRVVQIARELKARPPAPSQ